MSGTAAQVLRTPCSPENTCCKLPNHLPLLSPRTLPASFECCCCSCSPTPVLAPQLRCQEASPAHNKHAAKLPNHPPLLGQPTLPASFGCCCCCSPPLMLAGLSTTNLHAHPAHILQTRVLHLLTSQLLSAHIAEVGAHCGWVCPPLHMRHVALHHVSR